MAQTIVAIITTILSHRLISLQEQRFLNLKAEKLKYLLRKSRKLRDTRLNILTTKSLTDTGRRIQRRIHIQLRN